MRRRVLGSKTVVASHIDAMVKEFINIIDRELIGCIMEHRVIQ
jgi:hypothetical protein